MKKYSTVTIDNVWVPPKNIKTASATAAATIAAEELRIDAEIPEDLVFSDDYVYSTVRAISARVNMNMDGFMREELLGTLTVPDSVSDIPNEFRTLKPHNDKFGYRTFIGKNNHVDHYNMPDIDHGDPELNARHAPRGKILWAWYEEDDLDEEVKLGGFPDPVTKMSGKDSWVKLLIANDRNKYPVLCRAIEDGIVTKVSMGAEVIGSSCSVCGQFAGAPWQYCPHIRFGRSQPFPAEANSPFVQAGIVRERDPILAFENNHGLQFFEESWILDIQADPTAVIMDLIKAEPGQALKTVASTKSKDKRDYKQIMLDLINYEPTLTEDTISKISAIMDKNAQNPNVSVNIENVEDIVDKLVDQPLDETQEDQAPFDYSTTPDVQPGEHYPEFPFPCSARASASRANPEYPMDTDIDVMVCQGCMYNKSDKIGAVNCQFPTVTREGGSDPLPPGFAPPDEEDTKKQQDSGLKNEDGTDIEEYPGIQHPPNYDFDKNSSRLLAFYKLKSMLDIGTGSWKMAADLTERDRPFYPYNKDTDEIDSFEHTVGITIPSMQQDGDPVDPEGRRWVIDSIKKVMSKEFGGVRVKEGAGGFVEGSKHHQDDTTYIESGTDDYDKAVDFITDLAYAIEDAFNQYAVEFWIDGEYKYTRDVH